MAADTARARPGDTLHALLVKPGRDEFPNLVDGVYDRLWKRIVNLDFPPGARLSDVTLAQELGVSRSPVREALHRLSQDGLVRVNARRGFFVATISRQDASEIFDLRTALEVLAARRATPLLTEREIAVHIERQRQAERRAQSLLLADVEEFVHANLLLHDMLLQRAGNRRLLQMLANLKGQMMIFHLHTAQDPERRLRAIAEHQQILAALLARDAVAVAAAMEAHLQGVKERVLEEFFSAPAPKQDQHSA